MANSLKAYRKYTKLPTLKQKTTRTKPYLEANHSKKPIRDFNSISMYTLAHPQIMYTSEVFNF